ncbi:Hypothetical predicted protein [Prunus dulcis]|uniref:Uncharacterized protein n=1 Tax=Prunus dulcis TaxID=3755 RepID=A0A5E4FXN0_PRUDU|nr:hypothetical protein L3X38_026480 [Prunus dulcis]VVA32301.1 Hypothetical predicted protein [Prunus dulcis]
MPSSSSLIFFSLSHISSSSSSLISFSTSSASSSSSSFLLLPSPDPVKAKRSLRVKTETKAHTEPFVRASVIEGIGSASVLENPPPRASVRRPVLENSIIKCQS